MGGKLSKKKTSKIVEKSNTDTGVHRTIVSHVQHVTTITERSRSHSFSTSHVQGSIPLASLPHTISHAFTRNVPNRQFDIREVRGPIGSTYRTIKPNNPDGSIYNPNIFQASSRNNNSTITYPTPQNTNDLTVPTTSTSKNINNVPNNQPILKINVIKNYMRYDNLGNHIPTYNTFGKYRGMSFIINNINFNKKPRIGADVDEKNLQNLFNAFKISTKITRDLSGDTMKSALKSFAKGNKLMKEVDMCFIVIMSHGTGSMDTMTEIAGIDNNNIKVFEIIQAFSNENCPALKGKPKIFIFQCCRGENERKDEHDVVPIKPLKCEDMLIGYATMPGYVAIRNTEIGSPYIRAVTEVFMKHACDTHIQDMLVTVQGILKTQTNSQQTCCFENLSFKNCYLHPV